MDKKNIRRKIVLLRENIDKKQRIIWDKQIFYNLINSELYKKAKNIFIYVSYKSEVDTVEIIKYAIENGKNIYVPKTYIKEKNMKAIKITNINELIVDNYGILEPKVVDKDVIGKEFDIIIIPGVVFDQSGNRIGYGGGYYDRYLSENYQDINKVALAYDLQMVDGIENEKHDIKMNYIITNKNIIKIN